MSKRKTLNQPVDVKSEVKKLGLECIDMELTEIMNLKVGTTYKLTNPKSIGPYLETVDENDHDVIITNTRYPRWIISNEYVKENDEKKDYDGMYVIEKIQFECKNYGKITRTNKNEKYNLGVFVYLKASASASVSSVSVSSKKSQKSQKLLELSYELQTDKGGKYKVFVENTNQTFMNFTEQFIVETETPKRIGQSLHKSGSITKRSRRGGNKNKTSKRRKEKKSTKRGGMKAEDKEFFETKKEKVLDRKNTNILFNLYKSPEKNPRNMISSDAAKGDANRVVPLQSKFMMDLNNEGEFLDMDEAGLTFS
jgi:hypothetical protein